MEKYGSQAIMLGGRVFGEFYQLYGDYSLDNKTFGRIVRETTLRENAYRQLVNAELLALSKRDNEYLLSEMKANREEKGKGPAIEEMSDEEGEEVIAGTSVFVGGEYRGEIENSMDYYGDEPSSKRSKLSDNPIGSDTGSTSMETGEE